MKNWRIFSLAGSVLLLAILACASPTLPEIGLGGPPSTPTPMGDSIVFGIPAYLIGLAPGDTVPGTQMTYLGANEAGGFNTRIDGQDIVKRTGDSFFWNGVIAPGILANYNLRIGVEGLNGTLQVAGPVEVFVLNPQPIEVSELPVDGTFFHFRGIPIDYRMPVGSTIPGTTISYIGTQEQGGNMLALLSGSNTYARLALVDSMIYSGQLLPNVFVRYSLRVSSIDENGLRLSGTAELWVK